MGPGRRTARLTCIALGIAANASAHASATVCEEPSPESFAAVTFIDHEQAELAGQSGSTNQENQNFDVLVASPSTGFAWGFAHRYVIFDFTDIDPQTNAHLHTTFAPLHWTFPGRRLRASVAPALSASSNVMGHPAEWEGETPQLLAALIATSQLFDEVGLRYGLCGDHRFGEYRLYPVAVVAWRFRTDWRMELGFPTSSLRYEPVDAVSTTLAISPDGNEWHVKNRDFTSGSRFVYEAVVLEWTTDWRVRPRLTLSLRLGRQLDNRYEMTLAGGERVTVSGEPANRVGFGIRWRF